MKAIRIQEPGSFDALKLAEIETPLPGEGQVLVRMVAASVNFADTMVRKGTYPVMPSLPIIPGFEGSGIVEEIGPRVTHVKSGQPVIVFGARCYAEYVVVDAHTAFPIPEEIDLDEAAVLPVVYLTAYHLLNTMAPIQPGHTILVHAAAGGVGTAVAQLAKDRGVTLIGLTSSVDKARYARDQGFHHLIQENEEPVVERVRVLSGEKGADVILNSVAGNTLARDIEMLGHFGQVIWYGVSEGPPQGNLTDQLLPHLGRSVGIRFFSLFSVLQANTGLLEESMAFLIRALSKKKLKPHIFERIPLSEAPRAHELLESRAVMGKIILRIS